MRNSYSAELNFLLHPRDVMFFYLVSMFYICDVFLWYVLEHSLSVVYSSYCMLYLLFCFLSLKTSMHPAKDAEMFDM